MSRNAISLLVLLALLVACERPTSERTDARAEPLVERASDELVLDRREDGATLLGRLEPYPENADPDRVLTLRAVGLGSLDGARVLDARFVTSGVVVLGADHELALVRDDGTRTALDTQVEPPLSVVADRVAYVRGEMPEFEVALTDVRTLEARTITQGMAPAWSPALSPDARELVFVSGAGGSPRLFRVDASGSSLRALAPSARFPTAPVAPRWEGGLLHFEDEQGAATLALVPASVDDTSPESPLGGGR